MTGNEQLRKQLETMEKSLRAFEHPVVEEVPGLRLMHESLRQRRQHIADTIAKNETCSIELTLAGAVHHERAVPATLVAYVLDAVAAAVEAAGLDRASAWDSAPAPTDLVVALACHVEAFDIDDEKAVLTLTRPPGALAAQLADPESSAPLFEHAAVDAFTALGGDEPVPAHLVPSLHGLAESIAGGEFVLAWSVEPFVLEPIDGEIDQAAAMRLAARATG